MKIDDNSSQTLLIGAYSLSLLELNTGSVLCSLIGILFRAVVREGATLLMLPASVCGGGSVKKARLITGLGLIPLNINRDHLRFGSNAANVLSKP